MDVITADNDFEVADHFKEDDTPVAEKLDINSSMNKDANWCVIASPENKERIDGNLAELNKKEPEVLPILDLGVCHELSNYQLLEPDLRNDPKECPLKQSGLNDHESDGIASTLGPTAEQGQEVCEHNNYFNNESPKSVGLKSGTDARDSDSHMQEYSEEIYGRDNSCIVENEEGIYGRDNSCIVENENYNSQKIKSFSHDIVLKEHSGDTMTSHVKESELFHEEVNGCSSNHNSVMKDGYYRTEMPTSGNEKITDGDYDVQKEPVSPKELMSGSPARDFNIQPSREEKMLSARMDDRGSLCYHNYPNQNQSHLNAVPQSESSPSTTWKISSPGRLTNHDSCHKTNSPKNHSYCGAKSPPIESHHSADSPRKSHRTANSPPLKSCCRAESPRESHQKASSHKHMSKSPRRRDTAHRNHKSTSRSPVLRDASGNRRSRHQRSRSRSPRPREHHRRSPRRGSPRHRSPATGYRSHRRSPRRRWSPPSHRETGVGRPGRNLFVAGFSFTTTERDLERKFSRFGRVTDVRVVRNTRSGDSRGFGFLSLEKDEDADAAIRALDQTEWNGRIVLVEKSKSTR